MGQIHSAQINDQKSNQQYSFNEQKYLADRCRLIKNQADEYYSRSSACVHVATRYIEDYLLSVNTPTAYRMLCDLQQAGYGGFEAWCEKYGI